MDLKDIGVKSNQHIENIIRAIYPYFFVQEPLQQAIKNICTPRNPCFLETIQYLPCPPPVPQWKEKGKESERSPRRAGKNELIQQL